MQVCLSTFFKLKWLQVKESTALLTEMDAGFGPNLQLITVAVVLVTQQTPSKEARTPKVPIHDRLLIAWQTLVLSGKARNYNVTVNG